MSSCAAALWIRVWMIAETSCGVARLRLASKYQLHFAIVTVTYHLVRVHEPPHMIECFLIDGGTVVMRASGCGSR